MAGGCLTSERPKDMDSIQRRHGRLDVVVNNAGISGFEGEPVPRDSAETADQYPAACPSLRPSEAPT